MCIYGCCRAVAIEVILGGGWFFAVFWVLSPKISLFYRVLLGGGGGKTLDNFFFFGV